MDEELLQESPHNFSRRASRWLLSIGLVRSVLLLSIIAIGISVSLRLLVHIAAGMPADRPAAIGFISAALIPLLVVLATAPFVLHLILDLEKTRVRLHQVARTDGLTGALNRVAFMGRAEASIRRAADRGEPLSLLMIDIDRFKSVNDTYGHASGDRALETVAARCQAQLRPTDLFARFGGEEFVVLLPATDEDVAHGIAEKIRLAVYQAPVELPPAQCLDISVSIGSAGLHECRTLGELLHRADQNLYHAKRLGRNTLCIG